MTGVVFQMDDEWSIEFGVLLRRVSWRWRPGSAWLGVVGLKMGWDQELSSGLMFFTFMSVQFFQVRFAVTEQYWHPSWLSNSWLFTLW